MATVDWYYDYHERDTFPHQQELCEVVAWTKYNFEGQLASKTMLTRSPGNPLTIRLLAVKEALNQLTDYIGELDLTIKAQTKKQLQTRKFSGMSSAFYGKGDAINTGGAPMEVIKFDGEKTEFTFKYIIVQSALYKFFINFSSVMDRLAYEINLLYELNIRKIDWPKLIDKRENKNNGFNSLYKKDKELASLIEGYSSKFESAFLYRNKLVHVGLVDFDVNFHDRGQRGLYIMLEDNSNIKTNVMNLNAAEYCTNTKVDMLKLLDKSYELMIQYCKTTSVGRGMP